jgi:TPR repeat protein
MKTLVALVMVGVSAVSGLVCAQTNANKTIEQMKFYEAEAAKLPASEIFKVLELEREEMHKKSQNGASMWSLDEANIKAVGYASALNKRREAGDAYAALYDGVYNTRVCRGLQLGSKGQQTSAVSDCWQSSLAAFKIASTAGIADGARNVAIMYENGNGVVASKLVAAEWHVKAANQFLASGARDAALISLEAALKLEPDHPSALRLKSNILK